MDCFYEGPNMLVIHPDECIDCALCEPECPVDAIFSEDEIPEGQEEFLEINAELAEIWPNITEQKSPPPDEADWRDVPGKRRYLERCPTRRPRAERALGARFRINGKI